MGADLFIYVLGLLLLLMVAITLAVILAFVIRWGVREGIRDAERRSNPVRRARQGEESTRAAQDSTQP